MFGFTNKQYGLRMENNAKWTHFQNYWIELYEDKVLTDHYITNLVLAEIGNNNYKTIQKDFLLFA